MTTSLALAGVPGRLIGTGRGSIVLIHEWWGLNGHIVDVATRFAARGHTVFAVDLYDGKTATDAKTAQALLQAMDRPRAVQTLVDARAALKALRPGEKTAILGFCMGGGLALEACLQTDFAGCVPFYGLPPRADWSKLACPVQGHYAKHDDFCTPERVRTAEAQLGARATFFHYDAHHAFFNDTRPEVFSRADAELAFGRACQFLDEVLA